MKADRQAGRTDDLVYIQQPGPDRSGGLPAWPPEPMADPAPDEESEYGEPAGPRAGAAVPARLTTRGAGLVMFMVFFPGTLAAGWLHLTAITGLTFLAGCILAGLYTRRADLLMVITMPPMIFLIALICVKTITSTGSTLISTAAGCILTLSAVAAWLFGGVAVILVIALLRGLPQTVRDFRVALLHGRLDPDDPRNVRYRP
jgi:hypothetical protein